MRPVVITLLSLFGLSFARQTGDYLGSCDESQLNVEQCYDADGFEQCGPQGWVYQECPVGTNCYTRGEGVICHQPYQ